MTKFKSGDIVVTVNGDRAVVIDSYETINIEWKNGVTGTWPADCFELVPRKFKPEQWVRITSDDELNGEIGFVLEDDGSEEDSYPYLVGVLDDIESEEYFSASELAPWKPKIGERVVEAGVEDDEAGTVIGFDATPDAPKDTARVLWDSFPVAQNWFIHDLEPADEGEGDEIEVGDSVEYSHPMLVDSLRAIVVQTEPELLGVKFASGPFQDGFYNKDFFSKAA